MSTTKPRSPLVALVWVALLEACGGDFATDGGPAGSLNLNLDLSGNVALDSVEYSITGNGITPIGGFIDVAGAEGVFFLEVRRMPAGPGFSLSLSARDDNTDTDCAANRSFDVAADAVTTLNIVFKCSTATETGGLRLTGGDANFCPVLTAVSSVATPNAPVRTFDLLAEASDAEADNITYSWLASNGSFANNTGSATTFSCVAIGDVDVTVAVAEDGDTVCSDAETLTLFCDAVGLPWGTPALLETGTGDADHPEVAVDPNGNATVVWRQSDGSQTSIWTSDYPAGGAWSTPVLLEYDDSGDAIEPAVATDPAGNQTAVWAQYDGAYASIWASRRLSGEPWGTPTLLESNNAGNAYHPEVAADQAGNVVVVWVQADQGTGSSSVYANRYPSGGPWETAVLIETIDTGSSAFPRLAIDPSGNATVAWRQRDGTRYRIWANRYPSGGPWGTAQLVSISNQGDADFHQLATDTAGNVTLVWSQYVLGSYSIYVRRDAASGAWGIPEVVDDSNARADLPALAVDALGTVTVAWRQQEGGGGSLFSVRASRSVSGGLWEQSVLLETGAGPARHPQVAADGGGNVTAVWEQWDGAAWSIYAARHYSGVWSGPVLLESDDSNTGRVRVAVDPLGSATVVWAQGGVGSASIWANRFE